MSISKDIVSYDTTDYAWYGTPSNINNGIGGATSDTYARITLVRGASAETWVYWNFGSFADIPADASIRSVSCSVRAYATNINAARIAVRQAQLYTGTTAKGSPSELAKEDTTYTMTTGSWTRAELLNARVRVYCQRGTSLNLSTNYYIYFYGATMTVEYSQGPDYTVLVKSSGTWVEPTKILVKDNGSWVEPTKILAKDNGTWQ